MTSEEFPTAAEVAKGMLVSLSPYFSLLRYLGLFRLAMVTRRPKTDDQKTAPESTSAKHRMEEEADTFRGVHLDPNAHHWDEVRLFFFF